MPAPPPPMPRSILLVPTASVALWWTSLTQSQGQLRKPQGIQMGVKGVEEGGQVEGRRGGARGEPHLLRACSAPSPLLEVLVTLGTSALK